VLNGFCKKDTDITVKVKGGDLIVNYGSDGHVKLTGNVERIYEGKVEF
jgi:diaminopimelate epimerase